MPSSKGELNSYKKYRLKKELNFLRTKKGFHTELITLMIPADKKIFDVTNYLKNEISESSNIKSKLTRKNVIDSITALLQKLKNIKDVPENGIMMFSGAIPQENSPGTERNELYIIEPIEPITHFKYFCSSEFYLKPLGEMLIEKERYGIIVIDNKEFSIGTVKGNYIDIIKTSSSGIASKHNAGGQSQRRFERLHDEHVAYFLKRSAESINEIFIPLVIEDDLEGIFIGGAGFTKLKLVKIDALDYRIKEKIVDTVDIGVGGSEGIRAILLKIQDQIANVRYIKERKLVQNFLYNLSNETGLCSYGEKEVRNALEISAVETLLVSEGLELSRITITCEQCDFSETKTIKTSEIKKIEKNIKNETCPKCNSNRLKIVSVNDVVEDLADIAMTYSSEIEMISSQTEEGETLISTFGGIAAILRFKIT
ncbi:MAG: peptide chain release factor aRF-1 [Promethearchaeota archaeon]